MRQLLRTPILARSFTLQQNLNAKSHIYRFATGEFPQALNYSRPFHISKLENGVTVASQIMPTNISSISVFIKCGSRNQTPQSSGTAHFLEHLHFKGTKNRTREELEIGVQNIGGSLNAYTSRENTCYMMTVFKDDLDKAVEIVGDMITNSLYRKQDVEYERSTIHRELIQTQKSMPMETTIELAHRRIYDNHQMGLPILGSIQNMQTISKEMIEEYHNQNYVGENIVLVAAGPIDHNKLIQATEKYIKVNKKPKKPFELAKPTFHPGISCLESHLTDKVNAAFIYQAPSFFDNRFFAYLLLQRILSDRPETDLQVQIMKNSESFLFQKKLAPYDFIYKQKGFYSSYWDTGLFGNYFVCEPKKAVDAFNVCLEGLASYSNKVTDLELERAKRKVFMEVLQHETQIEITQSIGNNILYYDRRVQTKQLAERVACVNAQQIQELCGKLVNESSTKAHICFWGNVNEIPMLQKMKNQ